MRMSSLANCPPVAISPLGQASAISAAAGRLRPVKKWSSADALPPPLIRYLIYSVLPILLVLPTKDPRTLLVNVRGAIFGRFNNSQKKETDDDEYFKKVWT